MILEARSILDTDKIERLAESFKRWAKRYYTRWRISELTCGASLAHHGLLGSVDMLTLSNVDLSPVPAKHLASLASCVTLILNIGNVNCCDLVSLLSRLKCDQLQILNQKLGREETQALVQAMESGVECVVLYLNEEMTLDIKALSEYSGQGVCRIMSLQTEKAKEYQWELRTWANSRNWRIGGDDDFGLTIKSEDY